MQLIPAKQKLRCEMGVCRNYATHSITMDRVGIRSQIHICDECLDELRRILDLKEEEKCRSKNSPKTSSAR